MAKTKKGVIKIGNTEMFEATQTEVSKAIAALRERTRKLEERKARKPTGAETHTDKHPE